MDRSEIKLPVHDVLPCWYELSWREDIPALVLRIHKDFVAHITIKITPDAPIVKHFQEKCGFKLFVADFNGNFGFDNTLINQGEKEDFIEYLIELPQIKQKKEEKCRDCGGSGKDEIRDDEDCLWCKGDGKQREVVYDTAEAISASLNIIFTFLSMCEKETSSRVPQLMTIILITEREMHGGSLGGVFTPPFSQWLKSVEEDQDKICYAAIQAMIKCGIQIVLAVIPFKQI